MTTPLQDHADLEAAAAQFVAEMVKVRRRPRPRIAPALMEAQHRMIPTALGAVATWRTAPGPAVLLVHGFEDDNSLWQPLLEALENAMTPAVVLDLPAHGFSEGDGLELISGGAALGQVAAAVGPLFAVVTHSFGGPLTVEAMEHHGFRPQRSVLIAPPLRQIDQIRRIGLRNNIPDLIIACAVGLIEARTGRAMTDNDLARAAPALPGPALFVHSADDEACPMAASTNLADLWPDGQALILDGLGHREIAREPGVCARIVDFLMEG